MYKKARKVVLLSAFSLSLLAVGCIKDELPKIKMVHHEKRPLTFATFPILEPVELTKALQPLTNYLGAKLEREVDIKIAEDYGAIEKMMGQDRVDFGWFKPRSEKTKMAPICKVMATGRGFYQGIIVVRKDSGITNLRGLAGKHFAYVDRNSNSGFVYPNKVIEKEGFSPLKHFGEISFAGSHSQCLTGLLDGTYDGAAMSDLVLKNKETKESCAKHVRQIAQTEVIWPDPIVINQNLDVELRKQIEQLLTELNKDEAGKAILAKLKSSLNIRHFAPLNEKK